MNWDDSKVSMLLFGIAWTRRMQTKHFAKFANALREKDFISPAKVTDNIGGGSFAFGNDKVISLNHDIGIHHVAFSVGEMASAVAYLCAHEVRVVGEATVRTSTPSASQNGLFFLTPWGMRFELTSHPAGKGCERDKSAWSWNPDDPLDYALQSRRRQTQQFSSKMQSSERVMEFGHCQAGSRRRCTTGSKIKAFRGPNASSPFQMRDPRVGAGTDG